MTHRDDSGNVQVDFVWGNMPMQPNDDRLDNWVYLGSVENVGWSGSEVYYSDTLRTADYYRYLNNLEVRVPADSHTIATLGYSNFPGYIPNYAGDEDPELEVVVPDVVRMNIGAASDKLDSVNLGFRVNYHNPTINYVETTGKTVRVYCYDTNASGGGYPEAYLVGLKPGDNVWVDNNYWDFGTTPATITKVNEDGENSWIEFETADAIDPALDDVAAGTIWPAGNTYGIVMMMRGWNQPGAIVNEGQNIYVRALGD